MTKSNRINRINWTLILGLPSALAALASVLTFVISKDFRCTVTHPNTKVIFLGMGRKNAAISGSDCGDRILPMILDIFPYSTQYSYPI
ncbi:hypothetical protein CDG77_20970 [Nostoc sp. 'Peltigera membranacea cyanobiont' 213]|uniref:hypothetical protein n=1 Tax=Nostoc sp. 'Peltigera membranacea cyanobiont' 213 TaxID=2014530 RepID=UPI000B956B89|nr:hypothetical protein [Nostoc sp. 'Peltigera membranacea cyanobiont' 213]OYD88934.1 hypothetical protein CDG77_20970 [Nostoc sp. 'Peltigera membranacea cyanobiont' 213]